MSTLQKIITNEVTLNNVTPMMVHREIVTFIRECDLSSKESYLQWVSDYKKIVCAMEPLIRRAKHLRKPGACFGSYEMNIESDPDFVPGQFVNYSEDKWNKAHEFANYAASAANFLGVAMWLLYEARVDYKKMSYEIYKRKQLNGGN